MKLDDWLFSLVLSVTVVVFLIIFQVFHHSNEEVQNVRISTER